MPCFLVGGTTLQWISKGLAPEHQKKKISRTAFWGTLESKSQQLKTITHVYISLVFYYQYNDYIKQYYYKNFLNVK